PGLGRGHHFEDEDGGEDEESEPQSIEGGAERQPAQPPESPGGGSRSGNDEGRELGGGDHASPFAVPDREPDRVPGPVTEEKDVGEEGPAVPTLAPKSWWARRMGPRLESFWAGPAPAPQAAGARRPQGANH